MLRILLCFYDIFSNSMSTVRRSVILIYVIRHNVLAPFHIIIFLSLENFFSWLILVSFKENIKLIKI